MPGICTTSKPIISIICKRHYNFDESIGQHPHRRSPALPHHILSFADTGKTQEEFSLPWICQGIANVLFPLQFNVICLNYIFSLTVTLVPLILIISLDSTFNKGAVVCAVSRAGSFPSNKTSNSHFIKLKVTLLDNKARRQSIFPFPHLLYGFWGDICPEVGSYFQQHSNI